MSALETGETKTAGTALTLTNSDLVNVVRCACLIFGAPGARGIGATPTLPTVIAGHLLEFNMQPKRSAQTELGNDVVQYDVFWVRTAGFKK